jgi:branched-chain amino acid transport system permease protein
VLCVQWAYAQRFGTEARAGLFTTIDPLWLTVAVLCLAAIGWLTMRVAARMDGKLNDETRVEVSE